MGGWTSFIIISSFLCICALGIEVTDTAKSGRPNCAEEVSEGGGLKETLTLLSTRLMGVDTSAERAFGEIHALMFPRLVRYASNKSDDPENLAQEALMRLWLKRDTLRPAETEQFLYTILSNAAVDAHRKFKGKRVVNLVEDEDRSPFSLLADPRDEEEPDYFGLIPDSTILRELHQSWARKSLITYRTNIPALITRLDNLQPQLARLSHWDNFPGELAEYREQLVQKILEDEEIGLSRLQAPLQEFGRIVLFYDLDERELAQVFEITPEQARQGRYAVFKKSGLLRTAFQGLPEIYRETLILWEIEDLKYREIAERINVPMGTIKSRLHASPPVVRSVLDSFINERRRVNTILFGEAVAFAERVENLLKSIADVDIAWKWAGRQRAEVVAKLAELQGRRVMRRTRTNDGTGEPIALATLALIDQGFSLTEIAGFLNEQEIRQANGNLFSKDDLRMMLMSRGAYEPAVEFFHNQFPRGRGREPFDIDDMRQKIREILLLDRNMAEDLLVRLIVQLNSEGKDLGTIANFLNLMDFARLDELPWTARRIHDLARRAHQRSYDYWAQRDLSDNELLFAATRDFFRLGLPGHRMIELYNAQKVPTINGKPAWERMALKSLLYNAFKSLDDSYQWRPGRDAVDLTGIVTDESIILTLYYHGFSYVEIAERLNSMGVPTRRAAPKWTRVSVRAMHVLYKEKLRKKVISEGLSKLDDILTQFDRAGFTLKEMSDFLLERRVVPEIALEDLEVLIKQSLTRLNHPAGLNAARNAAG